MSEFTDEQVEQAVHVALKEHDVKVIPGLLHILAAQNPQRAQEILDEITLGLDVAAGKAGVRIGLVRTAKAASRVSPETEEKPR